MARYNSYGALDDRMLEDLDTGFRGFNNRLRPDQLDRGVLADSQNGRMDTNGEWQTRKGIDNIIAPSSTGSLGLVLPFDLPANLADGNINAIYGSCVFSDPNDNSESYIILAANSKALAYKVSNPSTQYNLNYPGSETISASVDMIQAFNKLYIFRNGLTAFVIDLSATNIDTNPTMSLAESGEFQQPVEIICKEDFDFAIIEGRGVVHKNPTSLEPGDQISVVSDKLLASDAQSSGLKIGEQFTVAKKFESGSAKTITSIVKGAQVSGGEYDNRFPVTVTCTSHGFSVGDPIDITGVTAAHGDQKFVASVTNTNEFIYYTRSASTLVSTTPTVALAEGFEFFLDASKTDSHTTEGDSLLATPVFTQTVSVGLGFSHMPAASYGVYHQRRLAVPYRYSTDDADNSFTDRKIFDEILLSDILDTDTYDQVYGQFRFNAGKSDFNVGMHSFSDDKLIVFNRNSIHIVLGSGDLTTAKVQLLTDEVGLLARKSIVQVGNQVLFLSDNGVYGMNFIDLYNLRGNDVPLSESINQTIKRINKEHASKATATYFDNKYYLAVPLDNSTQNNALLIYNFLNKSWEAIDTVGAKDVNGETITPFEFSNLLVAGEGTKRAIYITNDDGGVHQLEVHDDGIDKVFTDIGGAQKNVRVNGSATTRMFTFNQIDRKRFNNFELHIQSNETTESDATIAAITENVDDRIDLTPGGSIGTDYGPFREDVPTLGDAINGTGICGFYTVTDATNTGFSAIQTDVGSNKIGSTGFLFNFLEGDTIEVSYTISNFTATNPSFDPQLRGVASIGSATAKTTGGTIITANGDYKDTLIATADGTHLMFADSKLGSFTVSNFKIVSSGTNNIPKREDISVRGRIGNPRSYGMQMEVNSILGRPRVRSVKVAACEAYRSTSSVK